MLDIGTGTGRCRRVSLLYFTRLTTTLGVRSVGYVSLALVRLTLRVGTNDLSDFADDFPEAEVVGTDISPTQTTWVPPNLKLCAVQVLPGY